MLLTCQLSTENGALNVNNTALLLVVATAVRTINKAIYESCYELVFLICQPESCYLERCFFTIFFFGPSIFFAPCCYLQFGVMPSIKMEHTFYAYLQLLV